MKNLILSAALIVIASFSFSQSGRIGGVLLDKKTNEPIEGASVILKKDSVMITGRFSNLKGRFFFDSIPYGSYRVEISFVGYSNVTKTITVNKPRNFLGRIAMEESTTSLKTFKTEDKIPIAVQKGDTTEFNADAFKTNKDATTGDLVEKMPGITNKNGQVNAQGEQVKQVLVDGKPFFGQDPKSAMSNIPAEVVQKIQVFDDQSEDSKATGLPDGNTVKTINIITKPEYRNSKFGNVYAGYGLNNRYNAGGNYNIFNGDQRISFVSLFNNVNQQNFSSEDLVGISAGSGGGRRGGGRRGGIRSSSNNFVVPQQNGIAKTAAGGVNFQDTWGKTEFIGSYFYNNTRTDALENSVLTYFSDRESSQVYDETDSSYTEDANRKLSIQLKHSFNRRSTLTLRANGSLQDNFGESFTDGLTSFGSNSINQLKSDFNSNLLGYNSNARLYYNYRFKKRGRSFMLMGTSRINGSDGVSNLFSTEDNFSNLIDTLNQQSTLISKTNSYGGRIRYTEPLGKKGGVSLDIDMTQTDGKTNNLANSFSEIDEDYSILSPEFSSQFTSDNFTQSYGLGYRFFSKKVFSFVRAKYQLTNLKTNSVFPATATTQNTFQAILPFAMMKYTLAKGRHVFLMYRTSTDDPSVVQLQNFLDNSNPLQLQTGNNSLKQEYTHRIMSRYISTNVDKATTFFAMGSFSFSNNYISSTADFYRNDTTVKGVFLEKGKILNSYTNLSGYRSLRLFSSYGMPIKFLKSNLNLDGGLTYSRTPSLVNDEKILANSMQYEAGITLSSNISENVDFTLSGRLNLNEISNQEAGSSLFLTQEYKAKAVITLPNTFVFRTSANYQMNSGFSDELGVNFLMWNASIAKKIFKSKKGELSLGIYDVLNQNDQLTVTTSNTYVEQLRSRSLQRYALLTFRYTFRQFKKAKKDPMDQFYRRGRR